MIHLMSYTPFVGTNEEDDVLDFRTNPFQGGGDDGRGPSTNPKESQISRHIGPTIRAMAKRLDEDWNTATDGRETYLYMFQVVQNQA